MMSRDVDSLMKVAPTLNCKLLIQNYYCTYPAVSIYQSTFECLSLSWLVSEQDLLKTISGDLYASSLSTQNCSKLTQLYYFFLLSVFQVHFWIFATQLILVSETNEIKTL